jgi:putative transposase
MAHTYTQLLYHLIWSTKERRNSIEPIFQQRLYQYIGGIAKDLDGSLLEIGGMPDHIHLLTLVPPKIGLSDFVKQVKVGSTKWLRDHVPGAWAFAWQQGYGAFSVSRSNEDAVAQYIANQEEHHKKKDFRDEFLGLLRVHEVTFDEKYLWR